MRDIIETQEKMRALATMLDEGLNTGDEKKTGFALIVFDFNQPGVGSYVSNGRRDDMILAMKETVGRLENNEDIPGIPEGRA